MTQPLRLLIVEDNAGDAELMLRELRRAGFEPDAIRVDTEADYLATLHSDLELILSDYSMPQFSGLRALELLKERGLEIPFILVSATIGEETAVSAMRSGAADYLLKDRLTRLGHAVEHALEQKRLRDERTRAEKAMQHSEHKYRHLFESLSEAAFLIDAKSRRILDANLCAEKLLGRTRTEILGMNEAKLFPPNDAADYCGRLALAGTAGTGELDEAEVQSKDGTTIPVRVSLAPIELHGRDLVLALMTDVTERKRAEERLREQADMLDRAHDAIVVRNFEDRRIVFWNSGAERLYGWSASEAIGQPVGELILADPQEVESISKLLLSTGEFRGQLKEITKDKRELTVEVWSTLIRNTDGTPRSVLSINNDITEQKNLETQLLRAQRLESIGTLAAGVAHDLNNILGPILMGAESLRGNLTGRDAATMVSLIEDSARRGTSIVKQVLTFARGIEGERVIINPRHLIDEMVDIARKTFPKSIEIRGHYPEFPWSIKGDPTQLHQVLLNLSVNARDVMANGGSLVLKLENFDVDEHYASMTPGAKPGPHAVLCVSDTGVGMPPAMIDKIFDPFFTTKEIGKGTGLGLSTTLGIVKSHGGFISVNSEQGCGTTFQVFLPAFEADTASRNMEAPLEPMEGNGELVLLVDDEPNIRRITKMTLEKHNYLVLEANDGPEALAIFAQQMNSVSVVLTDIVMPYMDGIALIRTLKKMQPDMIFIASTGQGDEPRLAELQELGVVNFLSKPYDTTKLLTVLESAVSKQLAPLPKKVIPGTQDQLMAHTVPL
jgi:PAS domain S-box-containing protein